MSLLNLFSGAQPVLLIYLDYWLCSIFSNYALGLSIMKKGFFVTFIFCSSSPDSHQTFFCACFQHKGRTSSEIATVFEFMDPLFCITVMSHT